MQSEELKPCPFCGGPASIEQYGDRSQSTIYSCDKCSCTLETGEEFNHGAQWNCRAEAAPPAPSVAVKALEWERRTTISRCNTITGDYHVTFDRHEWQLSFRGVGKTASFNVSRHLSRTAAEAAAQKIHEDALSPYLSAQVQDVAGWQPINEAEKDRTIRLLWSSAWLHPIMGYWSSVQNCWLEYASRDTKANVATHFMPLPAAPAAQEGGTNE